MTARRIDPQPNCQNFFGSAGSRGISSGSQLDLLWVEFFVSGNEAAVRRIIQVLEWPDRIREELERWLLSGRTSRRRIFQQRPDLVAQKIEDALGITVDLSSREIRTVEDLDCFCTVEGLDLSRERFKLAKKILPFHLSHEQKVEIGIKASAKWSLAANALGDSRIRKICEEEAGIRKGRARIALLEILVAVHRDLGEHERAAQFLQQYVQLNPEGMRHFVGL